MKLPIGTNPDPPEFLNATGTLQERRQKVYDSMPRDIVNPPPPYPFDYLLQKSTKK